MSDIPTLRDVAASAGVSKSTAQRALANDPRCSGDTGERVRKVAREMNYVPDPIFAAVGTRRRTKRIHGTPIAYIVALSEGNQEAGEHYFPWCQSRATELGYRLEMIDVATLETPKRLWQTLYARGFAGVLIGSVRSKFHPLMLQNTQFPAVCVGRIDPLPFHTTRPAIQLGLRKAWEEMFRRGYRRIGAAIFKHDPPVEDDFSRFSAVLGLQMNDLSPVDHIPPFTGGFFDTKSYLEWIRHYKPDAVLGFHDGLYFDLIHAGYKIPRDIGFASLHKNVEDTNHHIAGVCENAPLVALSAVNFLDQMVRHGERGRPQAPVNLMVEGTWSQGKTLRSRAPKPRSK